MFIKQLCNGWRQTWKTAWFKYWQSTAITGNSEKYRQEFKVKRQELHKESRKLRRARNDNDSTVIAQQEQITDKLKRELKQIRLNENDEIRHILTPDQLEKFEEIVQQRKDSVGSSRDEKDF